MFLLLFSLIFTLSVFFSLNANASINIISTSSIESDRLIFSDNLEKTIKIKNTTSTDLDFKIMDTHRFVKNFQGEDTFTVNSNEEKVLTFKCIKPLEKKEVTIKYTSTIPNICEIHIVLERKVSTQPHTLAKSNEQTRQNKPNTNEGKLSLVFNNYLLDSKTFLLEKPSDIKKIYITNTGDKTIAKNEIQIIGKLKCFKYKYTPIDIDPNSLQPIELSFNANETCINVEHKENLVIKNYANKLTIILMYKEKIDNNSEDTRVVSEEKLDSGDKDERFNIDFEKEEWAESSFDYTITLGIFVVVFILFLLWLYLRHILKKKNREQMISTTEANNEEGLTDSHSDKDIIINKLTGEVKELKFIIDKLLKEKDEKEQVIKDLNEKHDKKENELNGKIDSLESQLEKKKEEFKKFNTDLYNLTIETINDSSNNFSKFDIVNLENDNNLWSYELQQDLLNQVLLLIDDYTKARNYNQTILETMEPVFNFYKLSKGQIKNPAEHKLREFFQTHFDYYETIDLYTPIDINLFERYLLKAVDKIIKLRKMVKSNTSMYSMLEDIYVRMKSIKSVIGTAKDRSKLLQRLNIQVDGENERLYANREISLENFVKLLIEEEYTIFSDIIKLNIYKNAKYNDKAIKDNFNDFYIHEESLDQLVTLTKAIFILFNISFIEVNIFNDKFDQNLHDPFDENQPTITRLFPEYQPLLYSMEKDVIIDVFEVGFQSENPMISNKKTVVVVNA